jgi:hypothetical protein
MMTKHPILWALLLIVSLITRIAWRLRGVTVHH